MLVGRRGGRFLISLREEDGRRRLFGLWRRAGLGGHGGWRGRGLGRTQTSCQSQQRLGRGQQVVEAAARFLGAGLGAGRAALLQDAPLAPVEEAELAALEGVEERQ